MITKEKVIDEAIAHFNALKPAVEKPKLRPVKMTINGQTIALSNGKAVWKRIGDAKLALRNEFDQFWYAMRQQFNGDYHTYFFSDYDKDEELKEAVYQFVITNVIRFEDA